MDVTNGDVNKYRIMAEEKKARVVQLQAELEEQQEKLDRVYKQVSMQGEGCVQLGAIS